MKATEARFLDFLKKSPQFVIPIYQRTYSWTEKECQQLWADIVRTGANEEIRAHFVGSIVYIDQGLYHVTSPSSLLVIDGQQRLTTATLLLEALARHLGDEEPVDGFSAKKLRNYYLVNPLEDDERRFKLLLTQTDKDSLLSLIQQKPEPADTSIRINQNFAFFEREIARLGDDIASLCKGLAKLLIVDIALSREQDNPQLIFESMNSTGKELSQADLIRNFILMGLRPELQKRVYENHWRPMELAFGQEAYGTHFDGFMRHYLTLKSGEIPKIRAVYDAFKRYTRRPQVQSVGVEAMVADVHAYAGYYCAMALDQEPDGQLAAAFRDLRDLKVDVAFPFLLELYHDYAENRLTPQEMLEAVRLTEAYVFRRAACAIPTNSHNKTFSTFGRALRKDQYLTSIKAHFLTLPSYRRFPDDEEFKREFSRRDLYNFPRRSYWLRRIENHDRKEPVPVDEYTVEHILPQNENLPKKWRDALGSDWQRIRDTWLHTLGNLTLTAYNSEYSDHPFQRKRDMRGGFKESPLRLNKGLGTLPNWNETNILERAKGLSELAAVVWWRPKLAASVIEEYQPKSDQPVGYTLENHVQLVEGAPMRSLFEQLRKEILALHPCVSEEILKLYIAYKAETNFVDVVPQKSRLRLSLNMRFPELRDPRALARDVTNLGRWGNGDAEVGLERDEDLPYIMGLIRQAFERQMDDGASEV